MRLESLLLFTQEFLFFKQGVVFKPRLVSNSHFSGLGLQVGGMAEIHPKVQLESGTP